MRRILVFLIAMAIFTACNSQLHIDSVKPSDCTGAIPSPRTIKSVFPKSGFKLSKDSLTGYETVYLDNGNKFLITYTNCDYHTLYFNFEIICRKDSNNTAFWYRKGITLMQEVVKGIIDSSLIKDGIANLKKYVGSHSKIKLAEEIDFDKIDRTDFLSMARIDSVKNTGGDKYSINIMFSYGPL